MAPSAASTSDTDSGLHNAPYHLPIHLPNEPKIGTHVLYNDKGTTRDALVLVVFPEHGAPQLTLILIKPGNGGVQTKFMVPHKTKATNDTYWCRVEEVTR